MHRDLDLEAGDTVVFSSRVIPGNEQLVERITKRLLRQGVHIVTDEDAAIHASGHPAQDELRTMYEWVRPGVAIPTHGEPQHMAAHARLARETGVNRALTGLNGDLFMVAPNPGMRRGAVVSGRLGVGADGLEPAPSPDYEALAEGEALAPGI